MAVLRQPNFFFHFLFTLLNIRFREYDFQTLFFNRKDPHHLSLYAIIAKSKHIALEMV